MPSDEQTPDELMWEVVGQTEPVDYKVFSLYHHQAVHPRTKQAHKYVVIDCPSWINVIALTKEQKVVMIRQFRHGTKSVTLEIPGGMVDPGEAPLVAAKRELQEETGYIADEWIELGVVEPNPAIQTNRCWTFLALDVHQSSETSFDPGEVIATELRELPSVPGLIASGEITHSLVVAAFFHFLARAGGWAWNE
jgi:8-oxo-dGTP pyrophosphatase MutT (NUDIX family)